MSVGGYIVWWCSVKDIVATVVVSPLKASDISLLTKRSECYETEKTKQQRFLRAGETWSRGWNTFVKAAKFPINCTVFFRRLKISQHDISLHVEWSQGNTFVEKKVFWCDFNTFAQARSLSAKETKRCKIGAAHFCAFLLCQTLTEENREISGISRLERLPRFLFWYFVSCFPIIKRPLVSCFQTEWISWVGSTCWIPDWKLPHSSLESSAQILQLAASGNHQAMLDWQFVATSISSSGNQEDEFRVLSLTNFGIAKDPVVGDVCRTGNTIFKNIFVTLKEIPAVWSPTEESNFHRAVRCFVLFSVSKTFTACCCFVVVVSLSHKVFLALKEGKFSQFPLTTSPSYRSLNWDAWDIYNL